MIRDDEERCREGVVQQQRRRGGAEIGESIIEAERHRGDTSGEREELGYPDDAHGAGGEPPDVAPKCRLVH